jgi:hypothetical protein
MLDTLTYGSIAMSQKTFAVYRASPESEPKAVDISGRDAAAVDRIVGGNWYSAEADSAEAAITEFRRHETIQSMVRGLKPSAPNGPA